MILDNKLKPRFTYKLTRIGKNNDGGYLVGLNSIKKTNVLISLGINDDWSFEKNFYNLNNKIKIFAYDDQLTFFFLMKKIIKNFIKFFIPGYKSFFFTSIYNIFDYMFFFRFYFFKKKIIPGDIIKISKGHENIFFKIDIEGSEYEILSELVKIKKKITGIVIEFHDTTKKIDQIKKFIKKINLKITHVHGNNFGKYYKIKQNILEITLEKKVKILNKKVIFPHPLDMPNNPKKEDIILKFN